MTDNFVTPEIQRLIRRLQLFLGLLGFVLLLVGLVRVGIEFLGSDLAETFSPTFFTTQTLILAGVFALVGYFAIYATAAVGAYEPPALSAIRYGLMGISLAVWLTVLWAAFVSLQYALAALVVALLVSFLAFRFWQQVENNNLWRVFGQPISRYRPTWGMLVVVGIIGVLLLIALGIIYAILSDRIELPLSKPEAGELLYTTTFDDFNDEWDLPQGRQSVEIIDGEIVLRENTGSPEVGFYALLESRKFSDFDLRVSARPISGDDDNSYGVIFRWRDTQNYYHFEISGDGYYRLSKTEEGITESITQWIPSEIIHIGKAANEIRVVAKEDTFTFYVNQQIAPLCTRGENREPLVHPLTGECVSNEWQDSYQDDSFKQGRIALSTGTTQTTDVTEAVIVGFDNLLLVGAE